MTFQEIQKRLRNLKKLGHVKTFCVGFSTQRQPIEAFHVGDFSENQIIIEGGIHAREWIGTLLMIEQIKNFKPTETKGGIYFIPLTNPDGVRLSLSSPIFSLWKANACGVDINVNFDALWGQGAQNVFEPGPENYVGPYPNSEIETRNLINFSRKVQPKLTISYHSKGELIYYGFEVLTEKEIARDLRIAEEMAAVTGYQPVLTVNSTGGYSDWISMHLRVPAFTIEVGNSAWPHPIGEEHLPEIYAQNQKIPELSLQIIQNSSDFHKNL